MNFNGKYLKIRHIGGNKESSNTFSKKTVEHNS